MDVLRLYQGLSKFPLGKYVFSALFCWTAPYFGSIHPRFLELRPGRCVVSIKNRRAVRNHIGTVHAIAMCNMAEAAAGTCVEASLSRQLRWIPSKMEVQYLKKANTNLKAVCEFDPASLEPGENHINVDVINEAGERVFCAKITMFISSKK